MITELARVGCCVPANITALVDRLERKGLAQRIADPSDRRVTRAALTDIGRQVLAETESRVRGRDDRIATALPDRDLRTLVQLLGRLYVEISEPGRRAPGDERREGDRPADAGRPNQEDSTWSVSAEAS